MIARAPAVKKYLEVSVSGSREQREILLPTMIELGSNGFEETETHLRGYFPLPPSEEKIRSFRQSLLQTLRRISSNAEITFGEIEDRDWNEEWERSIGPIEIGQRIVVKPTWRKYTGAGNRIVVNIDPKMSFGTGYHETTRLMVRLLEKYTVPGGTVLDVGTGTGILAIVSVKLGARMARATDTDPWSVSNATENVSLNGVGGNVTIHEGTFPPQEAGRPGIICANLTLNDLKSLLVRFREILIPGGRLMVSGLLVGDEPDISNALSENGFMPLETLRENGWIAICCQR